MTVESKETARIWNLEREVAQMHARIKLVEDGVANFRNFQAVMRDHMTAQSVREEIKDRIDKSRAKIHFVLLGGLISLIVGLSIWFVTWAMEGRHVISGSVQTSQSDSATIPHVNSE